MRNFSSNLAGQAAAPAVEAEPHPREDAWKFLVLLGRRYSTGPKYLEHPAPSAFDLEEAVAAAQRAPDHRHLRPFRFVQVPDAQREHLGSLFAADAARRGHGAGEVERARQRAANGPALLAVVARVQHGLDEVPAEEQWITVGAGVMNFLNALHIMGYGAKLLSGASVRAPEIQAAFCKPGETLVAWIVAGTPSGPFVPKFVDESQDALSQWEPAGRGTARQDG